MKTLRIATRSSPLALWQAEHVAELLQQAHPGLHCELLPLSTFGDRWLEGALASQGGKGLFVKELESALLDGSADLAVHSLKDVPMELPPGLDLGCFLSRHNPHDALIGADSLDAVPQGAVIGTASQRRCMLIKARRPDLQTRLLRGNVNTRLAKLDAGEYSAIVLAASGLERLGLQERIGCELDASWMTPAPGQGILGVEIRADDAPLRALLQPLNDAQTAAVAAAERALSRALGGSCALPLAGYCQPQGGAWSMQAAIGLEDGSMLTRVQLQAAEPGAELGLECAQALRAAGGDAVLQALGQPQPE